MKSVIASVCMTVVAACAGPEPPGNDPSFTPAETAPVVEAMTPPPPSLDAALVPPAVYDQWADPSVRVINMPPGTWYLSGRLPLRLRRSNVTVNFAGSTLVMNPADVTDGSYPIQVASKSRTGPAYRSSDPNDPGTRTLSHLTGAISEATTELAMARGERVDLARGEQVMIHAGVSASDPFEAQDFIVATVAAVSATGIIRFAAPLGKRIIDYGDAAGLRSTVASGQDGKIGAWGTYPDPSNFSKGYGTDHGLERFSGPIVHDVTFNDLHLVLDPAAPGSKSIPNTMWDVSAIAVQNFTMNRTIIENPCGSALHLWRSFNVVVDDYQVVGSGIAKIWNSSTFASPAVSIWGGDNLTFRQMSVSGTNMTAFSTEVGPRRIWIDGLDYSVRFTAARDYGSPDVVLGIFSAQDPVRLTNVSLNAATTGGAAHTYFSYSPFVSDGYLRFPGPSLTSTFDFGYQKRIALNGTVSIGGVTYGPPVTEVRQIPLVHGSPRVAMPQGIYTAASLRLVSRGDVREIWDSFGDRYTQKALSGGPVTLAPDKWLQIEAGRAALRKYVEKDLEFDQPATGTVNGTAELAITYLPVVSGLNSNQNPR